MGFISGIVERITYSNEETGFAVIKIKSREFPDLVTVVGNLAAVSVGASIRVKGDWKINSKFGKQFSADEYEEIAPATIAGIEKYLGSGLIKGIGPVYAKRITTHFGKDTLHIIEEEPDKLIEVEGIGQKRIDIIKKAWADQKEIKNVMLFLQSNGVSTAYAIKIFKAYGNDSIRIVKENPFRLADDIWGIGFKTADRIAGNMGFDNNSYQRLKAGIAYVLSQLSNDGHCFAYRSQLECEAENILEVDRNTIASAIDKMAEEKSVIVEKAGEGEGEKAAIYLPPFYYSELGTAQRIRQIISKSPSMPPLIIDDIIKSIQKQYGIQYDEIQLEAINTAISSKFMVLTGGPGTGKTTTILGIIKVFRCLGRRVLLAAPTGRAAKRLSEATGMEAKTIHRLLEYKPPEGFKKSQDNPLECDVLIIDESSMMDIILTYNLLKAVSDDTTVILAGDVDQLSSVGPGNVLKDIIESGEVKVTRLTKIFRQALGSAIITNAHRINRGIMPRLLNSSQGDFFFIEEDDPLKIAETIKELCKKRLPSYYRLDPVNDIQVLCPMQKGETGAQNLNQVLQDALNTSDLSIKYGGAVFKLDDKVMQIKNNYDKGVFNGDIGRIAKIDTEDKTAVIRFDDMDVVYDVTELDEVVLAYATTVHKSQGSEFKVVVAPFSMQHYVMLQRNLLYTCVTRAKNVFVLIGSKKAIAIAVKNNKIQLRNTMMAKRLKNPAIDGQKAV